MKVFLCLLLVTLAPVLCRADDLSLVPSADWVPMNSQQRDFILKNIHDGRGREARFIDGAEYHGGGGASVVAGAHDVPLTKEVYDAELKELLAGPAKLRNVTMVDQQPEEVASLPGISVLYRIKGERREGGVLNYALFANNDVYVVTFVGPTSLKRTDPLVTSYLARIRVDPSAVPPYIEGVSASYLTRLGRYRLGPFSGVDLAVLGGAVVLIAIIAKLVPGR
jgi:hypothetical protein